MSGDDTRQILITLQVIRDQQEAMRADAKEFRQETNANFKELNGRVGRAETRVAVLEDRAGIQPREVKDDGTQSGASRFGAKWGAAVGAALYAAVDWIAGMLKGGS